MKHVWNNHESVRGLVNGLGLERQRLWRCHFQGFFFAFLPFVISIGDGASLSLHDLLLWIKELFISRLQTDVMRDSIIKGKY